MKQIKKYVIVLVLLISSNVSARSIPLYGLFEKELTNTKNYSNPFSDVELMVNYTSPTGKKIRFSGFYDGDGKGGQDGTVWKLRFMPDEPGEWKYQYNWSDGTKGGAGKFNSTSKDAKPGPWKVNQQNPYWFTDSHGNHFLPIAIYANSHLAPIDWQDAILWAVSKGYNTIVTPTINITNWGDDWENTTAFIKADGNPHDSATGSQKRVDPDRYNLKMWHQWDSMIKTAMENNIYIGPFEGPSGKHGGQDGKYPPAELAFLPRIRERFDSDRNRRLIKYFIARQGAYWNLAYWSLGSTEVYQYAVADEKEFQEYISYIASLTPWGRMITAHDVEQWHDEERRWLSQSTISASRKLNTIQTSVASPDFPHWGNSNIDNPYWQEARPNNELALDSHGGLPLICTECLWEGQGRAGKPLRIIWGMLTAGAHTVWADWQYGDQGEAAEHKWGSIGRGWIPIKPLDEHVFKLSQLGQNTAGDEQLKYAMDLLSTLEYWKMKPHNEVVTGDKEAYCLAEPGKQYLIYLPEGGDASLMLAEGNYDSRWFNPYTGVTQNTQRITGGDTLKIRAPDNNDWAVIITKEYPVNNDSLLVLPGAPKTIPQAQVQ